MNDVSRDIPEPIKRQVRQECYFGCVICGCPVFEYDHIVEFSKVKEHTASNLALLCEQHHRAKTTGKMSVERVIEARMNPFNATRLTTSAYRLEPNRTFDLMVGSNTAEASFSPGSSVYRVLWVNGYDMLTLHCEDGWISVSFAVTDESGRVLLQVIRGEVTLSSSVWDYSYEGTRLQVRRKLREILIDIDLSNRFLHVHQGCFLLPTPNSTLDGFVVIGEVLVGVMESKERSFSMGSKAVSNSHGGWALVNPAHHPELSKVGGFGFFLG
ncbi:HNH endonuclease [Zoogloea sp.]|uniref:HNH endonuclease n=1 Tax=Zoogloea sp. TaxID=49181 RepID=UPI0035ADE988